MTRHYCPFCQRDIEPAVDEDGDVIVFEDGGMIFIHDDVTHDEDFDFKALQ